MTRRLHLFLVTVVLMSGCATDPASIEHLAKAHAEAAKVQTFTLKCSGPCEANYTDPRDRPQLALPTNGWDALRGVSKDLTGLAAGVAPWYAVGTVAVEGIKRAGGNNSSVNTSSDSHDTVSTATTSTTTTTSTSSVVDDHSVNTDSHASSVDSHNTDSHNIDSTHAPTVVTQPAPVVVMP